MRKRQWKELLQRLDRIESTLLSVHDHMNDCAKFNVNHAKNDKGASELMQEGIDNILGYQWPPKKEGNK